MERITIRRFDIGADVDRVSVRGHGLRWLYYALNAGDRSVPYMTDGYEYVRLSDENEWFETYKAAIVLTGSPAAAVDLTCERVRYLMEQRGDWSPLL